MKCAKEKHRWDYLDADFNIQAVQGSGFSSDVLAIISPANFNNFSDASEQTIGMMCPVLTSTAHYLSPNTNPTDHELNSSWYTTQVFIDFGRLESLYERLPEEITATLSLDEFFKHTITHELGHALKLTHTFIFYNMDSGLWEHKDIGNTLMNGITKPEMTITVPQGIDIKRFHQKWSGY